jgi:hypothetical protein
VGELSETTRRRIAAALLALGALIALLAILDAGPFEDEPTEEERVAETVGALYGAAADSDFEAYCGLLTPAARDEVRASAARLVEQGDVLRCEEILDTIAKDALKGLELKIRDVSVSGNRARVEANLRRPDVKGVEARTVLLERGESGEWLVADPG